MYMYNYVHVHNIHNVHVHLLKLLPAHKRKHFTEVSCLILEGNQKYLLSK